MDFDFSREQEDFRREVQAVLDEVVTESLIEESRAGKGWGPFVWQFVRNLGARGWLNPGWPKQYGGLGLSEKHTFIVYEEIVRREALPTSLSAAHYVGPLLLRFGSEEHKSHYLPRIARGDIEIALGYSEPEAGSDLASIATRAIEDAEGYTLNGQKVFPTAGMYAQYIFTLARTNPDVPKHKGLSIFIVDLNSPGIERRPLSCMGSHMTSQIFFDNVKVPKSNLFGEKNQGWRYLLAALDHERIILTPVSRLEILLNRLVEYARQTIYDGKPLAKEPVVRQKLSQMAIEIEAVRVLRCRAIWMLGEGIIPDCQPAMLKLFYTEVYQCLIQSGMEILGLPGQLKAGSKWAPLHGELERLYRYKPVWTIGGGTAEILRNVIALRGLGLPT